MSKSKREKFTATITSEQNRHDKPLVQVEGKLTEAQLEAIAGDCVSHISVMGDCGQTGDANHNETMVSATQLNG